MSREANAKDDFYCVEITLILKFFLSVYVNAM